MTEKYTAAIELIRLSEEHSARTLSGLRIMALSFMSIGAALVIGMTQLMLLEGGSLSRYASIIFGTIGGLSGLLAFVGELFIHDALRVRALDLASDIMKDEVTDECLTKEIRSRCNGGHIDKDMAFLGRAGIVSFIALLIGTIFFVVAVAKLQ